MLQNSPLYAYIPAKDVARARRFYEDKLGLKAREEVAGGVVYEFGTELKKRGVKFEDYDMPGMSEGNILAVIQSL